MRVVYHIAARSDWDEHTASGTYAPRAHAPETAIVCAEAAHYVDLANRSSVRQQDVVLLFIDTARLPEPVRAGVTRGVPTLLYPPPLPVDAVFEVDTLGTDADGRFVVHHETPALAVRENDTLADVRDRALSALGGWHRPWWVAGGWALDLHLGETTRPHADLEISILAGDQAALHAHLRGRDLRAVTPGSALVPWDGRPLVPPYHQIWTREATERPASVEAFSSDPTMLDFLIEDHVGSTWHYRRDHRVSRDVRDFGGTRDGLPFVRPEVALLFKAKEPRYKDQLDFRRVAPTLDDEARAWLRAAIETVHPGHAWLTTLGRHADTSQ